MNKNIHNIIVLSACLTGLLTSAQAQTTILIDDNFDDWSDTGNWILSSNGTAGNMSTISIINDPAVTSNQVLQVTKGTSAVTYRPFDSGTTLTLNSMEAGTILSLSFSAYFTLDAVVATSIGFGFVNNDSDKNSVIFVNRGGTASSSLKNQSSFRFRAGSSFMGDTSTSAQPVLGQSWANSDLTSKTWHTFQLDIVKYSEESIVFNYYGDGTFAGSATATTAYLNTYGNVKLTGISIRSINSSKDMYIDNASVTLTAVPEPATMAMLLAAAAGVVTISIRRRARH